jgi:cytochrome c-type biogenesis protein CcmH/NrfF
VRRARSLALAAVLVVLAAAASASPAAGPPRASFNDVEAALMCDTCNVPLNIAESTRADQERAAIRRLIAEGKTKQEILDVFEAEYGPNILAEPAGGGAAVVVWAVPAAILLVAVVAVALLLPRWKRRRRDGEDSGGGAGPDAGAVEPLSRDDAERLERDLALYDR